MKKGDVVKFNKIVKGISDGKVRVMRKFSVPEQTGIVLGYSFIKTGKIVIAHYYDEPNYLFIQESHKVLVIEPMECYKSYSPEGEVLIKTDRYLEPVRCLESDLNKLCPSRE